MNLSAFAISELRIRGVAYGVLGLVLAAAGVVLHGAGMLVEALVGAGLCGGWLYWAIRARIGWVLSEASAVPAAVSEPSADTQWRAVGQMAPVLIVVLLLGVVFRNVASVAGIPLGAGIAFLIITARLRAWEEENSLRLLHQLPPGSGAWARWLNGLDPADFSLCTDARVSPAMAGTHANRI